MCSPSLAVNIAGQLGYIAFDKVRDYDIAGLNSISEQILGVFGPRLDDLELKNQRRCRDLARAYLEGVGLAEKVREYKEGQRDYMLRRARMFKEALNPGLLDYLIQLVSWPRQGV
jgi:hypothetical protein